MVEKIVKCENCGNNSGMKIDESGDFAICEYCGTKKILKDIVKLQIEGLADSDETLKLLKSLENKIVDYSQALSNYNKAPRANDYIFIPPEITQKIVSEIGQKPKFMLSYVTKGKQRKQYFSDRKIYKTRYNSMIDAYKQTVRDARVKGLETLCHEKDRLKQLVDEDDVLASAYKDINIVRRLIGYIQCKRAVSITDAVNLYHKELQEEKMLEEAKKQTAIAQKQLEIAKNNAISSNSIQLADGDSTSDNIINAVAAVGVLALDALSKNNDRKK